MMQLDDLALARVEFGQLVERFVQGDQVDVGATVV